MTASTSFRDDVKSLLHGRLLDAAQTITVEAGWSAVTMAKIADIAGVSRQTVYNEFGSKPDLAGELVMRELGRFLDVVRSALFENDEFVDGIRAACEGALMLAVESPLLRAVLASVHQRDNDLVPLLTTESQGVIDVAKATIIGVVHEKHPTIAMSNDEWDIIVDAVVRLVLSHIMRPNVSPAQASEQIAYIASKVLPL